MKSEEQALRKRWFRYGGLGLALVGAGFSVASDAGVRRAAGSSTWPLQGTLGLCLLGAGLSIFGEAVVARTQLSLRSEREA